MMIWYITRKITLSPTYIRVQMIFVIDIGNTHTVAGIFSQNGIIKQWRIKTDSKMTADELGINYHNLFSISAIQSDRIEGIIMSSVVPQLEASYYAAFSLLFPSVRATRIFKVTHESVASLISIRLDNPSEVGADRLVNAVAAFSICSTNNIVIDFGTAITFDCISDRCEYLGGLILPGLKIALNALSIKAAKLPQIDISIPPEKVIGTCTVSAMKSGVMNGYGAMVEGLIERIRTEMLEQVSGEVSIVATGGMAELIKPFAPSIQRVEPNLTLHGLHAIYSHLSKN